MAINYPGSLDTTTQLPQPSTSNNTNNPSHAGAHDNESAAIIALENKVGTGSSTPTASKVLRATGTGTSSWAQLNLTSDVTGTLPAANGGTGTTTSTGSGNLVLSNSPTIATPNITNPALSGASGALTLPAGPDTLVGRNTTDTLKNKTLDNTNSVNGGAIQSNTLTDSQINWTTSGHIWWQELGRTTLGTSGTSVTVSSLAAKAHLRILIHLLSTGGTTGAGLRFNGDTGNNYAYAASVLGGAFSASTSQSAINVDGNVGAWDHWVKVDVVNFAAQEKGVISEAVALGVGAGTAPGSTETYGKWSNTSAQITSVTVILFSGTGSYAIGSEVIVLGHD